MIGSSFFVAKKTGATNTDIKSNITQWALRVTTASLNI
ncbi:hypothetical protein yinte0001_2930 [Yersinia intermedia ATCC 29909]|nr:hypothetical protein yinte0001_2930 [Yersinia intermedia ATCC 29909]